MAIELAIGVMFTMIAFTIMLLSTAGLQNSHRNQDYKEFNERIEINNVGEFVVASRTAYANQSERQIVIDEISTGYYVTDTDDSVNYNFEIYRVDGESKVLVLTIIMDGNKITSWK